MAEIEVVHLELRRGDNYNWYQQLTDPDGNVLPLRNVEIVVTAKPTNSDKADDSDALYQHTAKFAANGAISDAVGIRLGGTNPFPPHTVATTADEGVITEFLTPADIVALAAAYDAMSGNSLGTKKLGVWDMQVKDATGDRKTVLTGTLSMSRDVGRLADLP